MAYRKVFIGGHPRSGTTWLTRILRQHPDVICPKAESHVYRTVVDYLRRHRGPGLFGWGAILLEDYQNRKLGERSGLYQFVSRTELIQLVQTAMNRVAREPGFGEDQAAKLVIQGILDRCFRAAGGTPRHVLVEKTPNNILFVPDILRHFPGSKVVEIVRDGRDVCVSWEQRAAENPYFASFTRPAVIENWVKYVRSGLELQADPNYAPFVHRLHYEDLKRNPARQIARLCRFLELSFDQVLVEKIAEQTAFQNYNVTGRGKHNRRGIVGDWQNHFSAEQAAQFRAMVGDLFTEAGYRYETADATSHKR